MSLSSCPSTAAGANRGHLGPTLPPTPLQRAAGSKQVTVSAKKLRVAINGFGRIGRQFLRCWEGRDNSNLEVVVVNDSGGVKQASHLLKYDSTMGTFDAEVKVSSTQPAGRGVSMLAKAGGAHQAWVTWGGGWQRARLRRTDVPLRTAFLPLLEPALPTCMRKACCDSVAR